MSATPVGPVAFAGAEVVPVGVSAWLEAHGAGTIDPAAPQVEVATFTAHADAGLVGLGVVHAGDRDYMTAALTPDQARAVAALLTAAADVAQMQIGEQ